MHPLAELLAQMHHQGDCLANKPGLEYFLVSTQSDGLWTVDCHEHWARKCDFERHMRMNRRMTKALVG